MAQYFSVVSDEGRTFLVAPGFEILARWCKVCEKYETVDLDLGLYVSSSRKEELSGLVAAEFARIWDEYVTSDIVTLSPTAQEHRFYLQERVRICA